MATGKPTKGIRFGALVRVSTEKQEQQGESLNTQRQSVERDVARLDGTVAGWYGGQEHATPGWEKKEVDRLIADAAKGKFDAVMVAYADRWSRDNAKSAEGLEAFRAAGVRFFVGAQEYDLYNPEHRLFLGMSAVIGQYQAHQQAKKSLEARIERARRGLYSAGNPPFGRTFDRATGRWGFHPEKKALVEDVARRYLAGESMLTIGASYGLNSRYLHKLISQQCGPVWVQHFASKALNISEEVETPVPELLPPETIKAIHARAAANRTFAHGQAKEKYLLGRMIFCGHCGYALVGMTVTPGKKKYAYYRHPPLVTCTRPGIRIKVPAAAIEDAVLRDLFDTFGNPERVRKAVEEATPDPAQANQARARQVRLTAEAERLAAAKQRVVRLISKGTLTEDEADAELKKLRAGEAEVRKELDALAPLLEDLPDPAEVKKLAGRVAGGMRRWAREFKINNDFAGMTWDERRALCQTVFGGKTRDGRRLGVYVTWDDSGPTQAHVQRPWRYRILGRLIDQFGTSPKPPYESRPTLTTEGELIEDPEFRGGPLQHRLLKGEDDKDDNEGAGGAETNSRQY
jgi:DNA invertase Pin-like site-specific DNA recombinase